MKNKTQKESKKIILDLCGGTGSWSRPYKEAGYDVRNITLPDYDVRTYKLPDEPIYGILAAPPCTMFSYARTRAKKPRDLREGMETVIACLNLIWEARFRNKLAFWALENPYGYLRDFLGEPYFIFHPFDFGDRYSKKTCLWGKFKIPKKKPIKLTSEEKARMKTNSPKLPVESISYFTGSKQSARRAITPRGFAEAFYKANK
jgi:hypothetical protein